MQGGSSMDSIETEIRELYSNLRDSVPTQSGGSSDQLRELFQEIGIPYTENLRDDIDNLVNGGYELNGGLNLQKLKSMLSDNEVAKIFYEDGSPKPYGIILGILFLISTIFGVRKSRQLTKTGEQLKLESGEKRSFEDEIKKIKKEFETAYHTIKDKIVKKESEALIDLYKLKDKLSKKEGDIKLYEKLKEKIEKKAKKDKLEIDLVIEKKAKEKAIDGIIENVKKEIKPEDKENLDNFLEFAKTNATNFKEKKENEFPEIKDINDTNKTQEPYKTYLDTYSGASKEKNKKTFKKLEKIKNLEANKTEKSDKERELENEIERLQGEIDNLDIAINKSETPQSGGHYLDLNFCISCLLYLIIFLLLFIVVASLTGNEKMTDYIQAGFG